MSIQPLDLQTNFSQMNKVGRQVSGEHEADSIKQEVAGAHIQKESQKLANEVPQVIQADKDYAKIRDKKHRNQQRDGEDRDDEDEEDLPEGEESPSPKKTSPYITDPNLGHKIDIMS